MKIAVLCEFSGTIRNAFLARGHDAISCDLLPTESPGPHIQGDCREYDWSDYDMVIACPPCQYLSSVGNRAMKEDSTGERKVKRYLAFDFFLWCYYLENKRGNMKVCIENPKGYVNSHFRKPDQIVQPWYWGDPEMKTTCLWLRRLNPLIHSAQDDSFFKKTHVQKPEPKYKHKHGNKKGQNVYYVESLPNNWKERSRFFPGIANAMAEQ